MLHYIINLYATLIIQFSSIAVCITLQYAEQYREHAHATRTENVLVLAWCLD
jgi:hypothetical protein